MSRPVTSRPTPRGESAADGAPAVTGPSPPAGSKQPYTSPSLTAYGRLADLTRLGGSVVVDSGSLGLPL